MTATDSYRRINRSPIKGIILYYTEQIKKQIGSSKIKDVISDIQTGKTPPKANSKYYLSEDINWFKPSDIGYGKYLVEAKEKFSEIALKEKKGTLYPANTMLMIGIGGGVGRVSILKESGSSNQQITGITFKEKINPEYAYYYFLVREEYIKSLAKSMSFPILNQEHLKELDICFPDINKQNEFVKFIDECVICFENGCLPDFAKFSVDNDIKEYALNQFTTISLFDSLTYENAIQSQLLSKLRQSILQEAIQGKLTAAWREQNPNVEPAAEVLKRIKAERQKAESRKGKTLAPITESEMPFELPDGWRWCHGFEIFKPMETKLPSGKMFGYIDIAAIDNKNHILIEPRYIPVEEAPSRASRKIYYGSTLFSLVRPYLGNIAFIEDEYSDCIASTGFFVCTPFNGIYPKYIYYLMISNYVIQGLNSFMKGVNSPSINTDDIINFKFPLPPFSEQQVIVEKVEDLMGKCDQLQVEIENLSRYSKELLKGVFNETFEKK